MKIVAYCEGSGMVREEVAKMLEELEAVAMRYRPFVNIEARVDGGRLGLGEMEMEGLSRFDWKREVAHGDTNLGYAQWAEEGRVRKMGEAGGECTCIGCTLKKLLMRRLGVQTLEQDVETIQAADDSDIEAFTVYAAGVPDGEPLMSFSEWMASRGEQPPTAH